MRHRPCQRTRRAERQLQTGSQKAQIAAGDVAGLPVELGAQRPRHSNRARRGKPREHGSPMRRAGKYFVAEGLRNSELRGQLPFRPAQRAVHPQSAVPGAVAGQIRDRSGGRLAALPTLREFAAASSRAYQPSVGGDVSETGLRQGADRYWPRRNRNSRIASSDKKAGCRAKGRSRDARHR